MHTLYLDLYRRLIRTRLVEECIAREYLVKPQQMRCPVHLSVGQEAIAVGATAALTTQDALFATHRSHGAYIASGSNISAMFQELYGKAGGCCAGRGGSMHLMDLKSGFWGAIPIVGSTIPIATGAAFGFQMLKKQNVSMLILGEGATEEGVFHESIQYAVLKKLPVIFVCENNKFAVNTPLEERRPHQFSLHKLVEAHGMPTFHGDGNTIMTVYSACYSAIERARNGDGPTFLEFDTYRWLAHCGPEDDHDLFCRSHDDFKHWQERCPVKLAEEFFMENGIDKETLALVKTEEGFAIETALNQAKLAPVPDQTTASLNVYAGL